MGSENKGVLITGSSGFIGSNLVRIARSMGLNFTTLDYAGKPDIKCDISNADWNNIGLSNYRSVIHLAAKTSVSESLEKPEKFIEVNSHATLNLFRACVDQHVERVIFASSAAVYGSSVEEMISLGFLTVGKKFPVYLHPETREEYALARRETKVSKGHLGFEVDASATITLEEDLLRRDITINAIAENSDGKLIDPYDGLTDIKNRVIRHVSQAFAEDPLRVFRVARFMAELSDFKVADETQGLILEMSQSGALGELSAERVSTEMIKALESENPQLFFEFLAGCEGLTDWFPELIGRDFAFSSVDSIDRFCELDLDKKSFESLVKRLKLPKKYLHASRYWSSFAYLIKNWRRSSKEELYDCLDKTNFFHNGSNLARMLNLASKHGSYELKELESLLNKLTNMDFGQNQSSLTGEALGRQIRESRIQWLRSQY